MIDAIIQELREKVKSYKDYKEPEQKLELKEPDKERQLLYILSQQDRYTNAVSDAMKNMCDSKNEIDIKVSYERAMYMLGNLREVCDMRAKT